MQLGLPQLGAHLQKGLRSLYTLHGDEPLLIQEAGDAIRTLARAQGYTERTVHTVAGGHFDWSAVLAAGSSLSLFADRQIVEIRIPSGKPGKEGSVALQLLAALGAGLQYLGTELEPVHHRRRQAGCARAVQVFGVVSLKCPGVFAQQSGKPPQCSIFCSCIRFRHKR
jgi:DNA polymerase III delta subunit